MKIQYAVGFLISAVLTTALAEKGEEKPKLIRLPVTKRKTKALSKRDGGGTAGLYNDNMSIYLVNVAIGTPPQNFQLVLDTGSADLWVPGSQCASNICPLAKFNEQSSSTFQALNLPFNVTYGTGAASGLYCKETITIAGETIQGQQFAYVNATQNILTQQITMNNGGKPTGGIADNSSSITDNRMDGIFGLAYPFLTSFANTPMYNPFFYNLKAQNKISQSVFSVYLNSSEAYGTSGEVIFGGIDSTKYNGNISYIPVAKTTSHNLGKSDYGYWQAYIQGVGTLNGVGSSSSSSSKSNQNIPFDKVSPIIFDTGSTLGYLPLNVIEAILDAAVGANNAGYDNVNNNFQIKCSMAKQNIMIRFMMSTSSSITNNPVVLNIPLADLMLPMDSDYLSTASICAFGMIPSSSNPLLGEAVLRSLYQVYDADQNRIGVAGAITSSSFISGVNGTGSSTGSSSSSGSNSGNNGSSSSSSGGSGAITNNTKLINALIGLAFTFYLLQY